MLAHLALPFAPLTAYPLPPRPIYYFLLPSYWFPARVHGRDHLKQVERDLQHMRQVG